MSVEDPQPDPVDHCDECGNPLAYPGNSLANGTFCDGCYDRLISVLPRGARP